MKQVQRGFTLIELVMVIVILGVLAAVALPKFVDLKADAQQSAMVGVGGAAASASAINYAGCSIATAASQPLKCKAVSTCSHTGAGSIAAAMSGGTFPTGYSATFTTGSATSTVNGTVMNCTLTLAGYTASPVVVYDVIAAGN